MSRLQLEQNATAGLLTGSKGHDNVTLILVFLRWLPGQNLSFCKFVFKALLSLASQYISDLLCPLSNPGLLGSPDQLLLAVPRSKLKGKRKDDHAFAVAPPKLWNSLPQLNVPLSVDIFKAKLKTHMFSQAFESP